MVDDEGRTLEAGAEGELLVRGPQVLQGYWQRPEATAEAIDKVPKFVEFKQELPKSDVGKILRRELRA